MKKLLLILLCALTLSTYSQIIKSPKIFNLSTKQEGCISGDCENGQGTYISQNGATKYVGEWKDGKQHGQGTYGSFLEGEYVGEWKDGKKDGQGTYTYFDGDKYVGQWKDDLMHGQGTYTWGESPLNFILGDSIGKQNAGNKYVGEWKDGKKHGQGTMTWADGTIEEGLWENNKFIGE